jgi:hypothetical protein
MNEKLRHKCVGCKKKLSLALLLAFTCGGCKTVQCGSCRNEAPCCKASGKAYVAPEKVERAKLEKI